MGIRENQEGRIVSRRLLSTSAGSQIVRPRSIEKSQEYFQLLVGSTG